MIRLIKAEWYRLMHTGVLKYFVLVCLMLPVMTMMTDLNWYKMTLSENMLLFAQNTSMMMPMILAIAISIPIGQSYQNKTAYYEVMDGRKTHEIILSKVVLYTLIFFVGITVTFGAYFGALGIINGVGDMSDILLRFILAEVIIIRICVVSVLIYMLVKHIIGLVMAILRFMLLDSIMIMIMMPADFYSDSASASASELAAISNQSSSDWFITGQMTKIFSVNIDSKLILIIFISLILEVAFWYILTHISYKRKMFR